MVRVSAEVYEQKGSLIWGEFFFIFYNICFSQLTDQMNDYMATFQHIYRKFRILILATPDKEGLILPLYTLHTPQFGLT